jgi:hypothetical protein
LEGTLHTKNSVVEDVAEDNGAEDVATKDAAPEDNLCIYGK